MQTGNDADENDSFESDINERLHESDQERSIRQKRPNEWEAKGSDEVVASGVAGQLSACQCWYILPTVVTTSAAASVQKINQEEG